MVFLCLSFGLHSAQAAPGDDAFNKAVQEFKAAQSDERRAGRRDVWEGLAAGFLKIQQAHPKSEVAAKALFMRARCLEEMGLRSFLKADYQNACKYFAEIADKYPKHTWADDALLRKASIERDRLKDPAAARKTLEDLLARFKNGDMRGQAQAMLNELKANGGQATAEDRSAGQARREQAVEAPAGPGILRSITVRSTAAQSKVIVELSSGGKYLYGYVPGDKTSQAHLVLEFEDSRKAEDVKSVVAAHKGPVTQVRTVNLPGDSARAPFTRVELTLSEGCAYTFSSTANPPCLIVEINKGGGGLARLLGGGVYGGGSAGGGAASSGSGGASGSHTGGSAHTGLTIKTIMVDAGHGGKDPGAQGNGIKESALVLKVAKLVGGKLKDKGFKVLYTREKDTFISLEKRTKMANDKGVDLFLSIHVNANNDKNVWGIEAYYLDVARSRGAMSVAALENAVTEKEIGELQTILADLILNTKTSESKELCGLILRGMEKSVKAAGYPVRDNGVRSAPFYVLMGALMPSILVEVGYCTNSAEAKRLKSDKYLEKLTDGIVDGVVAYRKILSGK